MPEKEVDMREGILNKEYREWVDKKGIGSIYPALFPEAYKQAAINAMDEYMKERCLEFIQWMLDKGLFATRVVNGETLLYYRGEYITKAQLFENFL